MVQLNENNAVLLSTHLQACPEQSSLLSIPLSHYSLVNYTYKTTQGTKFGDKNEKNLQLKQHKSTIFFNTFAMFVEDFYLEF